MVNTWIGVAGTLQSLLFALAVLLTSHGMDFLCISEGHSYRAYLEAIASVTLRIK